MGRPEKTIDWKTVETRLEAGSPVKEVCACLHITTETFYSRFKEKYGVSYTDYSIDFHSAGKSNIRAKQYAKAMEGNVPMLIWLGKIWLGQKEDSQQIVISPEMISQFEAFANMFRKDQSALKIDDSNINDAAKS